MTEIIEAAIEFISRYLLPRSARVRLFALDLFDIARTMPPAVCMTKMDVKVFEFQADLFRKYYRLDKASEP